MRIIALVLAGASGIAATEPIDAILDSDDLPDAAQQAQLRDYVARAPGDVDRVVISVAEPYELVAVRSFEDCMTTSARLGWFTDDSRRCERELAQRRPLDWPLLTERRAAAGQTRAITDLAPPE